ncbi:MAG: DUF2490 domain-containing protein [Spirosomaceae bacterium]|nr:DUF2490 domain-containing protein [Spirosomataceae bacterium]
MSQITHYKSVICVILLTLAPALIFAQKSDLQLWTGVALSKKINKKLGVDLNLESRIDNNISQVGQYFVEATADYKVLPFLKAEVDYRYVFRNPTEDLTQNQRISGMLIFSKELSKKSELKFRTAYQYEAEPTAELGSEQFWRNRLELEHKLSKKWDSSLKGELWYDTIDRKAFDRYRITAGVDYEFVKNNVIQIFAAYQKELNRNNIKNVDIEYITGVRYKFKF